MLTSVQGVYRGGRVELAAEPANVKEETPVIVTFLDPVRIDLLALGINKAQAAGLRARLASFAEDWDSQEMSIYDDYDTARATLQAG